MLTPESAGAVLVPADTWVYSQQCPHAGFHQCFVQVLVLQNLVDNPQEI